MDLVFWGLSGRVSSEVSSDVCSGEGSQIQGGAVRQGVVRGVVLCMAQGSHLWGRVSSDVSSDVCMGEARKYCWIRFWSVGQGAENR